MIQNNMAGSVVKTLISVIVPIYNTEKYLPECIESIQNQTYSDLEIILVDDGATDLSGIIADEYAEKRWSGALVSVYKGAVYIGDKEIQREIIEMVEQNIFSILKNKKIPLKRKVEIVIIWLCPVFYNVILKK